MPGKYIRCLSEQYAWIRVSRSVFDSPWTRSSTEANLAIVSGDGERVPLVVNWLEDGTLAVITPTLRMALDTNYTLNLSTEALVAGGGANLGDPLEYSFHSMPYPGIDYTLPANGETEAMYNGSFTLYFKSAMKFGTVLVIFDKRGTRDVDGIPVYSLFRISRID